MSRKKSPYQATFSAPADQKISQNEAIFENSSLMMGPAPAIETHRNLEVWSRAIDLCVQVYRFTTTFPAMERFGLVAQLRRAAVSIPSNIAEGAARGSSRDFLRFLHIARGSLAELDSQLEIASRCGLQASDETIRLQIQSVGQLLSGLIRSIARKQTGR